jgi:hypothetical protein
MAKIVIKKLDVLSVAKIGGVFGIIIGFIAGLFIALFAGIFGAMGSMTGLPGAGFAAGAGFLAIIIVPIFYGIFMFIWGAIIAFLYNIIASRTGGIVFES